MNTEKLSSENETSNGILGAVRRSFIVKWGENIESEITEDFINKMSIDEFSSFLICKLPEKYLKIMRDTFIYIGDHKRLILLNHIKICRSLCKN